MTLNVVDSAAPLLRQGFRMIARSVSYTPQGGTQETIKAHVHGTKVHEVFAAAMQRDMLGVVDVEEFQATFGAGTTPRKYDRLRTAGGSYAVEEWRGAPHDDDPVFFKLLLRGGQQ